MRREFIAITIAWAFSISSVLSQATPQPPQINVSGSAEIKIAPDEIQFNAGIETRSPKLEEAKRANDERVAKVLQFLKGEGIKEKDVQTDFLRIDPNYEPRVPKVDAPIYVVHRAIGIRLTDVTKFDAVLSGLLTNGINHINGIEFRTSELRKHRDNARVLAIKAAREKADALASELGVKRGKVYNVNATEHGGWWSWSRSGYSNASQNVSQSAGADQPDTEGTMSIGQISVTATVTVSFLIE